MSPEGAIPFLIPMTAAPVTRPLPQPNRKSRTAAIISKPGGFQCLGFTLNIVAEFWTCCGTFGEQGSRPKPGEAGESKQHEFPEGLKFRTQKLRDEDGAFDLQELVTGTKTQLIRDGYSAA